MTVKPPAGALPFQQSFEKFARSQGHQKPRHLPRFLRKLPEDIRDVVPYHLDERDAELLVAFGIAIRSGQFPVWARKDTPLGDWMLVPPAAWDFLEIDARPNVVLRFRRDRRPVLVARRPLPAVLPGMSSADVGRKPLHSLVRPSEYKVSSVPEYERYFDARVVVSSTTPRRVGRPSSKNDIIKAFRDRVASGEALLGNLAAEARVLADLPGNSAKPRSIEGMIRDEHKKARAARDGVAAPQN